MIGMVPVCRTGISLVMAWSWSWSAQNHVTTSVQQHPSFLQNFVI